MADETHQRIPTSPKEGWSVDTALDYLLGLIAANDRRYEQRFEATQRALDLGLEERRMSVEAAFTAQKSAVDAAFAAQKDAIDTAFEAQNRAIIKAENATEKRFESVNEFRATLDNQQRTLINRSEVTVLVDGLKDRIDNLTKNVDEMKARRREFESEREGIKGGWGYAVGVVGFLLTILSLGLLIMRTLNP